MRRVAITGLGAISALGHDAEAMKSPVFAATLTRGAEWAAR